MNLAELQKLAEGWQDVITEEEMTGQPQLSRPPIIRIHQNNTMSAPEGSKPGMLYSGSSFCPPTDEITMTVTGIQDSLAKWVNWKAKNKHLICACAVAGSRQGVPFVENDDEKWHPGDEVRDCWYCPDYLPGGGMPKLERFDDDTPCKTVRTWGGQLLDDDNSLSGIPVKFQFGSAIFKPEYQNLQIPVGDDGVLWGNWELTVFYFKKLRLPMHAFKIRVKTFELQMDTGIAYVPIFSVIGIWDNSMHDELLALTHEIEETLALKSAQSLTDMNEQAQLMSASSGDDDDDFGEDAYDLSKYTDPTPPPPTEVPGVAEHDEDGPF